jgi:hypothetical protein
VEDRGFLIDRSTQAWVRATGRRVSFDDHPWLLGPIGSPRLVSDEWLEREAKRLGGTLVDGGGLLGQMRDLAGEGFDPSLLARPVVDFYECTSAWRLEVWSQWCPAAWPIGWLLSAVFSRRLQQLSLPLRPLDVALGMNSRVVVVRDAANTQLGAAWLRTLCSTGQTVYSGWYGIARLPKPQRPSVRVVFPLPNGSIIVFLRPEVGPHGTLILTSPVGSFGDDGAYLVVARPDGRAGWVRRVPIAERFVVWVDDDGVLRTDHALDLWHVPVIRLHYRMDAPAVGPPMLFVPLPVVVGVLALVVPTERLLGGAAVWVRRRDPLTQQALGPPVVALAARRMEGNGHLLRHGASSAHAMLIVPNRYTCG